MLKHSQIYLVKGLLNGTENMILFLCSSKLEGRSPCCKLSDKVHCFVTVILSWDPVDVNPWSIISSGKWQLTNMVSWRWRIGACYEWRVRMINLMFVNINPCAFSNSCTHSEITVSIPSCLLCRWFLVPSGSENVVSQPIYLSGSHENEPYLIGYDYDCESVLLLNYIYVN